MGLWLSCECEGLSFVVLGPVRPLVHHPQNYIELYVLDSLGGLEYEIDR